MENKEFKITYSEQIIKVNDFGQHFNGAIAEYKNILREKIQLEKKYNNLLSEHNKLKEDMNKRYTLKTEYMPHSYR